MSEYTNYACPWCKQDFAAKAIDQHMLCCKERGGEQWVTEEKVKDLIQNSPRWCGTCATFEVKHDCTARIRMIALETFKFDERQWKQLREWVVEATREQFDLLLKEAEAARKWGVGAQVVAARKPAGASSTPSASGAATPIFAGYTAEQLDDLFEVLRQVVGLGEGEDPAKALRQWDKIVKQQIESARSLSHEGVAKVRLRDRVINGLREHVKHLERGKNGHACDWVWDRALERFATEIVERGPDVLLKCSTVARMARESKKGGAAEPSRDASQTEPEGPKAGFESRKQEPLDAASPASSGHALHGVRTWMQPPIEGPLYPPYPGLTEAYRRIDHYRAECERLAKELALANKALDDIAWFNEHPWSVAEIVQILKRTGRLGGL